MKYQVKTFSVPLAQYLTGDIDREIMSLGLTNDQRAVCKICVAYNNMTGSYEVALFYTFDPVVHTIHVIIPPVPPRTTSFIGAFTTVCHSLLNDLNLLSESEQILAELTITSEGSNFAGIIYAA